MDKWSIKDSTKQKGKKMKKIIGLAVIALILVGCNDNNKNTPILEDGEKLIIVDGKTIQCDEPIEFKVIGGHDANVSIDHADKKVVHKHKWGIDVTYTIVVPCPEDNETIDPTIPIDGNCQEGWSLNDCGTLCTEDEVEAIVPPILCGEGTELSEDNTTCESIIPIPGECGDGLEWNPETELCDVIEPIVCTKDFTEQNGTCMPDRYVPEEIDDCMDGYTWGAGFCELESQLNKRTKDGKSNIYN